MEAPSKVGSNQLGGLGFRTPYQESPHPFFFVRSALDYASVCNLIPWYTK